MMPAKKENRELETLLKHKNFSNLDTYDLLRERLERIVSALHFSSQKRWGLQSDSQEIRALSQKFVSWMSKNSSWHRLHEASTQKPFSLDVFLGREWLRFAETQIKRSPHTNEPSYSAKRTLLELPLPVTQMSAQVLDAFSSLTQKLPEELRLTYQLHLEGLLVNEIAQVCELSEKEIQEKIVLAKKWIQNPDEWRIAS
jgi:DNA-directed RNA polymerase specialized sigma24 family protein